MEFFHCISLSKAQEIVAAALEGREPYQEDIPLEQAFGRVAARDIVSSEYIPPFSRSTVDGYAVNSRDTFGAGEGIPATLELTGEIMMGSEAAQPLAPGHAMAIPTGAMLPPGADAVVMLEHSEKIDNNTILILRAAAPGENIIHRGEDMKPGETIVRQGQRLGSAEIGGLAACGCSQVPVFSLLTVGIISTGDEIVDAAAQPNAGQIRDINSYALAAAIQEQGHMAKRYGIIPDNYEQLHRCLSQAVRECQMVLVSGGSSVGARDHTVRVLEALSGNKVLIHGLAVKPGKPTIFGMIGTVPVFGLPGHPVSAMTIFQTLVKPAVEELAGSVCHRPKLLLSARMSRNVPSAPGRDDYIRVRLKMEGNEYVADPVFGKSGLISTMVKADGLVRIPSESSGLYAGDWVSVELLCSH